MNIFVLSTGRCGSTTFIKACKHISNYSSGHESRIGCLGPERLAYPNNHIESDNRISWFLGRLDKIFGRDACYIHLMRDVTETAKSYSTRLRPGMILPIYARGIHIKTPAKMNALQVGLDYCETVNANIKMFLKDKPLKMDFRLSSATEDWQKFWQKIDAQGDFNAAINEWNIFYNKSPEQS